MSELSLREIGWSPFFEQQLNELPIEQESIASLRPARVSAHFGSQLLLLSEDGEIALPIQLADACGSVTVGDWLLLEPDSRRARCCLERRTLLGRKAAGAGVDHQLIAANIDTLFIVSSCNQDFNLSRLERYLALALDAEAVPVVVLTKADLCEHPDDLRRQAENLHAGLLVELLDARDPQQAAVLNDWCGVEKRWGF